MIYYLIAAALLPLGLWYLIYWWKYQASVRHKNLTIAQTFVISVGMIILAAAVFPLTIIDMHKHYKKEKRKEL